MSESDTFINNTASQQTDLTATATAARAAKVKRGNIRKRNLRDRSPDDEPELTEIVQDLMETQKLRKRPHGVCVETMWISQRDTPERSAMPDFDPMRTQAGGMVNLRAIKPMGALPSLESGGQHIDIGTEFSAETQRRDEDYDMMKFIEEEMSKRKSSQVISKTEVTSGGCSARKVTRPEDALLVVAEKYQRDQGKKSEEMLSQQMLSGIPEVDLGIEAKIRNIEATEDAKKRLMQKYTESPDARSSPTAENLAMNYMQHTRYNLDNYQQSTDAKPDQVPGKAAMKNSPIPEKASALEELPVGPSRSQDGHYYNKFKKNFMDKTEKKHDK